MLVGYRIIAARREFTKTDPYSALGTDTRFGNIHAGFMNGPFGDKIGLPLKLFCIKRCRLQAGTREDDNGFVTRINSIFR